MSGRMAFYMKRTILLVLPLLLAACTTEPEIVFQEPIRADTSSSASVVTTDSAPSSVADIPEPGVASENPASIRIQMPFASQAPHGNWDDPYQEACEEASLLLVHHYLTKEPLDNNVMDAGILDLVQWETDHGLPQDVTIAELANVAEEKYGYETAVYEGSDVTIERIEDFLAKGVPVIVPLQGQDIGNPNFSGDGPEYHMLVIIGYDGSKFITHDVGTRNGANYAYKKEVIMNAIHDWTGDKKTVRSGPKKILVVTKA